MADFEAERRSAMRSIHVTQSIAATLQRRLDASPHEYSRERCIYRVPNLLRQTNEQSYTPSLVSIGPLHHNDQKLLPMEAHKLKYLQSFLNNPRNEIRKIAGPPLNSCLRIVMDKETEIRKSYADPIDLSSNDFAQMVLIDSVFIIEFFMRMGSKSRDDDDYIFNKPFLFSTVLRDIKLEENQLPFSIIDELYRAAFLPDEVNSVPSLKEIACKVLIGVEANVSESTPSSYCHLLHLFACHRQPAGTTISTDKVEGEKPSPMIMDLLVSPPATQLHKAGVKFQVIDDSSKSLFDIRFDEKKGILRMPKLTVDDNTEYLCRNLIAFEQCHYGDNDRRYFTDYHFFLSCLINTPEDVKLLAKAGIIQNLLGSPEQVSNLINSLDAHAYTSLKGYYYEQISVELIGHSKKRWNRYRARLMRTWCGSHICG